MIGHPAVGMDTHPEMGHHLRDQLRETHPVPRPEENVLPMIASQDDVIERAIDVQTGNSWHPCRSVAPGRQDHPEHRIESRPDISPVRAEIS